MKSNNNKKSIVNVLPKFKVCSDWFKCPNCGYAEMRKILGDVSNTPCPECGHSPMYRVK